MKKTVLVLSGLVFLFACKTQKQAVVKQVEEEIEVVKEIIKEEPVIVLKSAEFNSKETFDVFFVEGIENLDSVVPTIKIDGGKVTGFGGCNEYFGTVNTTEKETFFSPIGSTRMMCQGIKSRVETNFFNHLRNADRGTLVNNIMTFYKGDKVLVKAKYVKKIIVNGDWNVIYMTGVSGGFGESKLEINIEKEKISGSTGCNSFSGKVNRKGYAISFTDLAQTEMACSAEKMEIEKTFNNHMLKVTRFTLKKDLVITFYDGNKMVMKALKMQR